MNEEDRKFIYNQSLETIRVMSDIDFQKRIWLEAEGPEVDSYCEFVNAFYPDIQSLLREPEAYNLSAAQAEQLQKLYDEFDKFKHTYYDEYEFIDSQEWKEMRELAAETLTILGAK